MTASFPNDLVTSARLLLSDLRRQGLRIAAAESCTGGLVLALLTEIPGASATVERGFVTYSDGAKIELLGVDEAVLAHHGAVSSEVARAMAEGALARSAADIAIAVTGIAGPDGGTAEKPVGLVHFAAARLGYPTLDYGRRFGAIGRSEVRLASVREALVLLRRALDADTAIKPV